MFWTLIGTNKSCLSFPIDPQQMRHPDSFTTSGFIVWIYMFSLLPTVLHTTTKAFICPQLFCCFQCRLVLSDDAIPSINPHYPLPGEKRPGAPPSKMRRKDQDEGESILLFIYDVSLFLLSKQVSSNIRQISVTLLNNSQLLTGSIWVFISQWTVCCLVIIIFDPKNSYVISIHIAELRWSLKSIIFHLCLFWMSYILSVQAIYFMYVYF